MSDDADASGAPETGTVIAEKYRVLGELGGGGMGCLVTAEHLLMKKSVAIKFLRGGDSAQARARMFREARAAQALSSENVVRVFDLGIHAGDPFIVMELLEGRDLGSAVEEQGPLGVEEAIDCILEACVGVAEAHDNGIIHRDLKPSNLFATRTSKRRLIKVLDFGISKVPDVLVREDCDKTGRDVVLGSPYYMSPEQLRDPASVDGRTDIWALAVTLHFLLTGEHPFPGDTVRQVMAAIFTDAPRDVRERAPTIPRQVSQVIRRALSKSPDDRFTTVAELADGLVPFASTRGRLAASHIAAIAPLAPADARDIPSAPSHTATQYDAARTPTLLGTTADAPRPPSDSTALLSSSGARRQPVRVVALPMLGVVALAATAWLAIQPSPRDADLSESIVPAASLSAVAAAPQPIDALPSPVAEPGERTSSDVDAPPAVPRPSAGVHASAAPRAIMPPRVRPRRVPTAAPAASTSAAAAPVAPVAPALRDVDGLPILD
jgi:serine/threonine-protein kinase